jgi:RNA polymerase sigma-70 factor (ECF subfamily)
MMAAGNPAVPAASRSRGSGSPRATEAAAIERAAGTWRGAGTVGDDRRVVAAVLSGNRDAFRAIVEREGPTVIAACTRVLGDHGEAEDIAQEAFVTAYRLIATWRADGPLGAWISRIAVRLALRRAAQRRQVVWLDPLAADADLPDRERYRTTGSPEAGDPAGTVIRTERDARLRAAVASLDEPYREVVALRFFAERSLLEIAEVTARPLGTVKTHLHRGLARLRRVLEEAER